MINKTVKKVDQKIACLATAIKPYKKPFIVIFACYMLAMLAVFRSGFSYMDDLGRALDGYGWSFEFNRYSSSILAEVLSANLRLIDVSPWFQILALAILSVVSLMIAYIATGWKTPRWPTIIASMFVGLTPLMAGCLLYKFDSVCIAASMFAAILPVAIWKKCSLRRLSSIVVYLAISTICILFVLTSYQACSGLVVVAAIAAIVSSVLKEGRINFCKLKPYFEKLALLMIACIIASAIFYFLLPSPDGYRGVEIIGFANLVPHVVGVVESIFKVVLSSMNGEWKLLLSISIIVSVLIVVIVSLKKGIFKIADGVIVMLFLIISVPVSYGIYILLKNAEPLSGYDWARYLVGTGASLAFFFAICFSAVSERIRSPLLKMIITTPIAYVLYGFAIFYLALGNGLGDQNRYIGSRINNMITLLDKVKINADTKMQLHGTIGLSPVMHHIQEQYPVVQYFIGIGQHGLSEGYWGELRLKRYYGLDYKSEPVVCSNDDSVVENEWFKITYDKKSNSAYVKIK